MTSTDSVQKAPAKDPWDLPDVSGLVVGVLGGTGAQGRGLAVRLAAAGQQVVIGSRSAERVAAAWEGHGELLADLREDLAGKIVVDCVNPLGFDKRGAYALKPEEGSAAE